MGTTDAPLPSWAEARSRLEETQYYWLATVRPDGRPHVMPVLAVWVGGSLHFASGPVTRKARNLRRDSYCAITADGDDLHVVVEGNTTRVRDELRLRRVADAYAAKYGWQVAVRDGVFHADGAPTAGPPPFDVYEVTPTTVFAFGTDESYGAARWRF
jgi:nitroimidazol reductase NimA-like FMN-containing flavoprotein (pyridoxamine 5'-phosphate oxidase superfamily)